MITTARDFLKQEHNIPNPILEVWEKRPEVKEPLRDTALWLDIRFKMVSKLFFVLAIIMVASALIWFVSSVLELVILASVFTIVSALGLIGLFIHGVKLANIQQDTFDPFGKSLDRLSGSLGLSMEDGELVGRDLPLLSRVELRDRALKMRNIEKTKADRGDVNKFMALVTRRASFGQLLYICHTWGLVDKEDGWDPFFVDDFMP